MASRANELQKWQQSLTIGSKVDFGTVYSEYPTFTLWDEMTITKITDTECKLTHTRDWWDEADQYAIGYWNNKLLLANDTKIIAFDNEWNTYHELAGGQVTQVQHTSHYINSNEWNIYQSILRVKPKLKHIMGNQLYVRRIYDKLMKSLQEQFEECQVVYVESLKKCYAINILKTHDHDDCELNQPTDWIYSCDINEEKWKKLPYRFPNTLIHITNDGSKELRYFSKIQFALVGHIMFVFNCEGNTCDLYSYYNDIFAIDLWRGLVYKSPRKNSVFLIMEFYECVPDLNRLFVNEQNEIHYFNWNGKHFKILLKDVIPNELVDCYHQLTHGYLKKIEKEYLTSINVPLDILDLITYFSIRFY
eukprot:434385_1